MSSQVNGTSITLTRGDTFLAEVAIFNQDGTQYIPEPGDSVRFAMKTDYYETQVLILKNIPIENMLLRLEPEDTKPLPYGTYVYDIQLTTAAGDVSTFISKAKLKLTEEVE